VNGVTIRAMSKTVPVADLAANLDALIADLAEKNEEIVITKDGREVARLVPMEPIAVRRRRALERFRGTVTILGDIVEPLDVEWDATK